MIDYIIQYIFNSTTLWNGILSISIFYTTIENQLQKMIIFKNIYNFIYNIKKEPISDQWTNVFNMSEKSILYKLDLLNMSHNNEFLFIYKNINYFVRQSKGTTRNIDKYIFYSKFQHFPSNTKFFYIEYSHSKLKKNIPIYIDPRYFMIGNEILSHVFIARYLDHTYGICFYQNDYILHLVDNNMKYFTMNRNHYLYISEYSYKIKSF